MMAKRYEVEVRHQGLGKHRWIRGSDRWAVEQDAEAQLAVWEAMWRRRLEAEAKRAERERVRQEKEKARQHSWDMKKVASDRTAEAQAAVAAVRTLLHTGLQSAGPIKWEIVMTRRKFSLPPPVRSKLEERPLEPKWVDFKVTAGTWLIETVLPYKRRRREEALLRHFEDRHADWESAAAVIDKRNTALNQELKEAQNQWLKGKAEFEKAEDERLAGLESLKQSYQAGIPSATTGYCDLVLEHSNYPEYFPRNWDLEYISETKTLLVDYELPNEAQLPTVKEVKYIATRRELTTTTLSRLDMTNLYEAALYQVPLRTIFELFEADSTSQLDAVVFNGWVNTVDAATGQRITPCILSLHAKKNEFSEINLADVDPKACFRKLKGVSAAKISKLTPVAPIAELNKEDHRFVEGYEVEDRINDSTNLAAMDWIDFENLIREVFEREFSEGGGEVKITQASRDGGVDAIAFDPDPIRGGKIVIQAKRYTNVVGVSAVRDLYGTVVNEGAIKGILVTTADYGPDAFSFAKDKPLTLLSGGHLLHLMEKHGHRARIDLQEAKALLKDDRQL